MRILVLSDTHGRRDGMEELLTTEDARTADWLVHCGDIGRSDEEWLRRAFSGAVTIVEGNNDFFTDLPRQLVVEREGHRFLILHGQRQVHGGLVLFRYTALENNCDIVLFGHTHKPLIEEDDGIWYINPGSLELPRQADRRRTYVVLDVRGKNVTATLKWLP